MRYYKLSNEQTKFLNEYHPQKNRITSSKEMDEIKSILGIGTTLKESELQPLRNSVVKFYSAKIDSVKNDGKRIMYFIDSMQSVTAVIDTMIYHYLLFKYKTI